MSETLLKILLSELDTVRVRCMATDCKAITEVRLADVSRAFQGAKCPVCGAEFDSQSGTQSALAALARAVRNTQAAADKYQVEFVLPQRSPDGK